jgi:hypothetical protein
MVPALAGGAVGTVRPLLAACDAAVADLIASAPEVVVCVGPGSLTMRHRPGAWGTFGGFGVALTAPSHGLSGEPRLPLSLTVGRWLLERVGWTGRVACQEVAPTATAADCYTLGRLLVAEAGDRAAWLVVGDGARHRSDRSPDTDDLEAGILDAEVHRLVAAADIAGLLALDAAAFAQLGGTGLPSWQVLAAAVGGGAGSRPVTRSLVRYSGAPFGVGYLVAGWWLDL